MNSQAQEYYPQLDSLRAVAVLTVIFSHFLAGGPWGDYGVPLFFVLSGFLITSIILSHKENMKVTGASVALEARNVYIRRSLRLFPIYYVALSIYLLLAIVSNKEIQGVVDDWVWHFSYLTNVLVFLRREWVGPLSPYWYLAVEEQFYIGWFWLVLLVPRSSLDPNFLTQPHVVWKALLRCIEFTTVYYLALGKRPWELYRAIYQKGKTFFQSRKGIISLGFLSKKENYKVGEVKKTLTLCLKHY